MDNFNGDKGSIAALILAGGAGQRVGGRDKGLMPWRGSPLVEHVYRRIKPQVAEVWISCNRNRNIYRQYAPLTPADLRDDYQGPLAGMEAAASSLQQEYILVVPCDTPALPANLATRLLQALKQPADNNVAYARVGDRRPYLCALLRRNCLESLGSYLDEGQRAVRFWYQTLGAVAVDFPAQEREFLNLNRPEELK